MHTCICSTQCCSSRLVVDAYTHLCNTNGNWALANHLSMVVVGADRLVLLRARGQAAVVGVLQDRRNMHVKIYVFVSLCSQKVLTKAGALLWQLLVFCTKDWIWEEQHKAVGTG